ncbi:hypothetical protein ACGFSB_36945 [Streptomyces sp. NPDC048441]|uniref:hypothetical protein n=1 Tax=Streptomyces sp. NPDC048441 TaxID=3365552 RepID=UPI00371652C7
MDNALVRLDLAITPCHPILTARSRVAAYSIVALAGGSARSVVRFRVFAMVS